MKSQPIIEIEVNRNNIYPYILRQEKIPDKKGKKRPVMYKKLPSTWTSKKYCRRERGVKTLIEQRQVAVPEQNKRP